MPFGVKYYSNELIKALKKSDAKIIHAAGYNTMSPLMALFGKKKNQKVIITLGSSKSSSILRKYFEKIYFLMLKTMQHKISYFVALSKFEKKEFSKSFPKNKFAIIPIAHEYKKNQKTIKRKKQVVSVGRLVKNKGFTHTINAFFELTKLDPEFKLIIIGEGDNRSDFEEQVKTLNLTNKVTFTGNIPYKKHYKLINYLKESAAFVFLSSYESQGVVVEEAICAGTPAIVTKGNAIEEFAKANLAYAFKQKDSKKIAEKIIEISKNPTTFTPKQKDIDNCYLIKNWKEVTVATELIYNKLLK